MSNPVISVIVPVYNVEKYINKCLVSIRQQTFKNIEIICVNDCSLDGSWEIVKNHALEDSRLVLVEHDINKGLGAARNTAIAVAKAEFLASVDSDDYIDANMLEVLWNASEHGEIDIVCCGFRSVLENGTVSGESLLTTTLYDFYEETHNFFGLMNPSFWNKLWRKSLFIENKIGFPADLYYEDLSTTIMILTKSKSLKIIDKILYNYLIRDNSITNRYSEKHLVDIFTSHQILAEFFIRNQLMSKYKAEFVAHFYNNITFEFDNLLNSNLDEVKKEQLVKIFSMMKAGFVEMCENIFADDLSVLAEKMGMDK